MLCHRSPPPPSPQSSPPSHNRNRATYQENEKKNQEGLFVRVHEPPCPQAHTCSEHTQHRPTNPSTKHTHPHPTLHRVPPPLPPPTTRSSFLLKVHATPCCHVELLGLLISFTPSPAPLAFSPALRLLSLFVFFILLLPQSARHQLCTLSKHPLFPPYRVFPLTCADMTNGR